MEVINKFREKYFFLSNFYEAKVELDGITYQNNEAAFQAQKCMDDAGKRQFTYLDPRAAKRKGRSVKLRSDWESVKRDLMKDVVLAKFSQNPDLREKLIATGDAHLEEGNTWGDRTWGTVDGVGKNWLGKILMEVRAELK